MPHRNLAIFDAGQHYIGCLLFDKLRKAGIDAKYITKHALQVREDQLESARTMAEEFKQAEAIREQGYDRQRGTGPR